MIGGIAAGALLSVAFFAVEARIAQPMLPLSVFQDAVFSAATVIGFAINFAFYGLIFVLSLLFQNVQGKTPFETGLAFVPLPAVLVVVNLAAGRFDHWLGLRRTLVIGLTLAAIGHLLLLATDRSISLLQITPAFAVVGAGIAMATPATMAAAINSVHTTRTGVCAGVVNAAKQVGGALGVALFSSLVNTSASISGGIKLVLLIAASALAAAEIVAHRSILPMEEKLRPELESNVPGSK